MKRRRKIPHLFAKLVVIWCIAFASGASYYAYSLAQGMTRRAFWR